MKNFKAIIGTTLVLGCFTILMFNKIKTLPNQWHDPETILYQAASKITHKHDIYLSALELSCPQGRVYELGLSLHTKKPYSLEEGRKIVVDAAEILLKQINTDPYLKESLCEYPFPNSRISIKLFVYNSLENSKLHKEITVTSLDRNLITYKKDASLSSYTLLLKETWDEAVNMIHADKNIKNKDEDLIHSSL